MNDIQIGRLLKRLSKKEEELLSPTLSPYTEKGRNSLVSSPYLKSGRDLGRGSEAFQIFSKRVPFLFVGLLVILFTFAAQEVGSAANPTPTATVVQMLMFTNTPEGFVASPTPIPPTATPTATLPLVVTNTPRPTHTPTIDPNAPTLTPSPTKALSFIEHYVLARPFSLDNVTYWARNYAFGSTDGGSKRVHHGIDFPDLSGTPVLAAAEGVVNYAGPDQNVIFGPEPNFYGNVVVIKHNFTDAAGQSVYTLYGHLSSLSVGAGQNVKVGQEIGRVGSTGIAAGAHLHLEVRVGDPTKYANAKNPELWVKPYPGAGGLAGRVTDSVGNLLPGVTVELRGATSYFCYTYVDEVTGEAGLNENFAIDDVADGDYVVAIDDTDHGIHFKQKMHLRGGQLNWIDIVVKPLTSG